MTGLPRIIGVCGYAQHGKDSLGDMLVMSQGYTKVAFANQLKSMALALNPIVDREPIYEEWVRLAEVVDSLGWELAKQNPEVRRFLQTLGTEGVRDHIGEDAWVAALHRTMDPDVRYVVTDVRFPNEESFIHRLDGWVFRVTRETPEGGPFDNGVGTEHPSEMHIATLDVDVDLLASDLEGLKVAFKEATGVAL